MLPQLALPPIEALQLLVESAFSSDTESRVFNYLGEQANEKQKTLDSRLKACGNDGPRHFCRRDRPRRTHRHARSLLSGRKGPEAPARAGKCPGPSFRAVEE